MDQSVIFARSAYQEVDEIFCFFGVNWLEKNRIEGLISELILYPAIFYNQIEIIVVSIAL